jgi:hypothetical protein
MQSTDNTASESMIEGIPKKALYLGLEVNEPVDSILNIVTQGLKGIIESYPEVEDANLLYKELEENSLEDSDIFGSIWKYPKADKKWHITTLFKKGRIMNKSHPAYLNFEAGKQIYIQIRGLVYVPKRIVTAIVDVDTPVENDFPHLTTLLGTFSAKHSNDVLKELFSNGKILSKEYKKVFKDELNEDPFTEMVEINLLNKSERVYVHKFQEPLKLETEMKVFYG